MKLERADKETLGWGKITEEGSEMWDANPVFPQTPVRWRDWCRIIFYPKKFFLYRYINKAFRREMVHRDLTQPFRILDVGCGTGATVIDFKRAFGRRVDVEGLDVVRLQIEVGNEKLKKHAVNARLHWYDGQAGSQFPFSNNVFDAVYTSDVLGHVPDVELWLAEVARVLKPGGALAMFAESELGKHAWIRNYLIKRGLNVDPHVKFHISLYSKGELKQFIEEAGFEIEKMYGAFWASFWVHPDEFYHRLKHESLTTNQHEFMILKGINFALYNLKKATHPVSTALCELYGLIEMLLIGRWLEAQGYVILAKKKLETRLRPDLRRRAQVEALRPRGN